MVDHNQLTAVCLEQGAFKAAVIETGRIPFDIHLRDCCVANVCGAYNKNWACPPSVGEPGELMTRAKSYPHILVYQTVGTLEDSFDVEGMEAASRDHARVSDRIEEELAPLLPPYLMLTAGGCSRCKVCAKAEEKPCRMPEKMLSSLEAYCINVSTLASRCGMKYINGVNTVTYFGAFLF